MSRLASTSHIPSVRALELLTSVRTDIPPITFTIVGRGSKVFTIFQHFYDFFDFLNFGLKLPPIYLMNETIYLMNFRTSLWTTPLLSQPSTSMISLHFKLASLLLLQLERWKFGRRVYGMNQMYLS